MFNFPNPVLKLNRQDWMVFATLTHRNKLVLPKAHPASS
jgi:hypothetical protein